MCDTRPTRRIHVRENKGPGTAHDDVPDELVVQMMLVITVRSKFLRSKARIFRDKARIPSTFGEYLGRKEAEPSWPPNVDVEMNRRGRRGREGPGQHGEPMVSLLPLPDTTFSEVLTVFQVVFVDKIQKDYSRKLMV